jgi:hypothetical protein
MVVLIRLLLKYLTKGSGGGLAKDYRGAQSTLIGDRFGENLALRSAEILVRFRLWFRVSFPELVSFSNLKLNFSDTLSGQRNHLPQKGSLLPWDAEAGKNLIRMPCVDAWVFKGKVNSMNPSSHTTKAEKGLIVTVLEEVTKFVEWTWGWAIIDEFNLTT